MRENKFKVWDNQENEWLEAFHIDEDGRVLVDKGGGLSSYGELYGGQERTTLVRYTGLKDKNGKDIFEGDLLDITSAGGDRGYVPVIFKDGSFGIDVDYWVNEFYPLGTYDSGLYEIVGNIYEHEITQISSNLLKEQE